MSTGRTGTKFFESFFGSVTDEAHCLHEPRPDLFELGTGLHRGELTESHVIRELRASRVSLLRKARALGKRVYIESNPNAALLLPQIKRAFPQNRIVCITRDIKTYLPSAYNKSPDDSGRMFFYADNDHRKRLSAEDIRSDPWHGEWPRFSRAERIAWWWQKCNSLLIDNSKNDPRCIRLKFESIFSEKTGPAALGRILDFFGFDGGAIKDADLAVDVLSKPRNQTRHSAGSSRADWIKDSTHRVNELTRGLREQLGYADDQLGNGSYL